MKIKEKITEKLRWKEPFFTIGLIKQRLPYQKFRLKLIWNILFHCSHRICLSKLIKKYQKENKL